MDERTLSPGSLDAASVDAPTLTMRPSAYANAFSQALTLFSSGFGVDADTPTEAMTVIGSVRAARRDIWMKLGAPQWTRLAAGMLSVALIGAIMGGATFAATHTQSTQGNTQTGVSRTAIARQAQIHPADIWQTTQPTSPFNRINGQPVPGPTMGGPHGKGHGGAGSHGKARIAGIGMPSGQ